MRVERFKELDGMRGLASIMVISYHIFKRGEYFTTNPILHFVTGVTLYNWYAIETFFVLSGFLITSILLRTKGEPHFFRNFYVRRSLRVFPLYYFALIVIIALLPIVEPDYLPELPRLIPILLLYQQNWVYIIGNVKTTIYLAVTWSLAVEEQFYLAWPFVVNALSKKNLLRLSFTIIGLSNLARILAAIFWTDANRMATFFFYNSFTRMEPIAFGVLLAIAFTEPGWKEKLSKYSLPVFLTTYITLLIVEYVTNPGIPHPIYGNIPLTLVGYPLAETFAAALIITLTNHAETSFLRRLFRNKILVFFGDHSYSMYLFHLPVGLILLDFLWRHGYRGWPFFFIYIGLVFAITTAISMVTWYVVERPMLNLKKYFEYKEPQAAPSAAQAD